MRELSSMIPYRLRSGVKEVKEGLLTVGLAGCKDTLVGAVGLRKENVMAEVR